MVGSDHPKWARSSHVTGDANRKRFAKRSLEERRLELDLSWNYKAQKSEIEGFADVAFDRFP